LREIARHGARNDELKSDRVVIALERQILSGRLPAGARLPSEGELCEILAVSRSVIRDAIRMLVGRGLVTVRQGRGMSVAAPTDAAYANALLGLLARSGLRMEDVLTARATIETKLVGIAAVAGTRADWAELEATLDRFAAAVTEGNDQLAGDCHTAFHTGILQAIHQPALSLMLRPMTEIILVSSNASLRGGTPEDWEVDLHRPILAALVAGDAEAAEAAMVTHFEVSTGRDHYQAFLERKFSDAYFDQP
jgi:DNA-binding FadR family transcriptional regulator